MSTMQQRLQDLATRIATENKSLRTLLNGNAADNSSLITAAKSNLVLAINELKPQITSIDTSAVINDSASASSTTQTYSVAKILAQISAQIAAFQATIDIDGDGKVNAAVAADTVPWSGTTAGRPSTFPPSTHDAALVTSGVFDVARIPVLPSQQQVVSTGDLTALTTPQQVAIVSGTVVTTTDGSRYVYSGTGTKTAVGSYVQLADITPDWSTIQSKPTTRASYGITDAQALDDTLTALAGLTTSANVLIYATGADAFATTALSAFARSILDDADGPTVRATIGALSTVEIGAPDTDFVSIFNAGLS